MTEPQDVVGTVELHATFPIRAGDLIDPPTPAGADDVLDRALDLGLEWLLDEAINVGSTAVTVRYRGDEASERTPR
jgi:hypothetical protein